MTESVSAKIGIKQNMRAIFINAPEDAIKSIDPSNLELKKSLNGEFDYIHFFANSQAEFHEKFPKMKGYLKQTGMLWVSWRKSGKNTDLNMQTVIKIGYEYGLVESKCISINSTWSALKFTHPKKGKTYKNSFGKLKI